VNRETHAEPAAALTANLFLVRHGAHGELGQVLSGRRPGLHLSAAGRAQAAATAERLAREDIRLVQSSPRERAAETAAIIAERLDVPMETVDALDEIDFGAWTGMPFDALDGDPAWTEWNVRRGSARAPGGETMAEAVGRSRTHLQDLGGQGGGVVCVSHADVIRGLIAHALGLSIDNMLRFDIDTASISLLLAGDWGSRVVSVNERVPA
jgi:broad specificity phosphatase PhoE